jgi:DNA-binding GntR family transcriptional regulator
LPDAQGLLRPVRLRDLCQITGRPRETIRRKLARLEAQGRVRRVDEGYVYVTTCVDEPMRELAVDALRRYLVTAGQIESALRDAEQVAGPLAGRRGPR